MSEIVWTQWDDLDIPSGFTKLSPISTPLDSADLSQITFYVPQYMGGRSALEYSRKMTSLKYLQVPNAGYDDAIEYLTSGVTLCNARGVHDASTAELAMGLAITARRGFSDFASAQQSGIWAHKRYPSFNDSNIAIIGAGSISTMLQRYLAPYDVNVEIFPEAVETVLSRSLISIQNYLAMTSFFWYFHSTMILLKCLMSDALHL